VISANGSKAEEKKWQLLFEIASLNGSEIKNA